MKNKLTIGLFNDSFYPLTDGVVMVVDNYARKLSKYANVIVFVPKYNHVNYDDSKLPYKVVRCKSIKIPFLDYSLPLPKFDNSFLKIVNSYNLDIVHIHSPFTIGTAGLNYAKSRNIPCIATMHAQFKQDFKRAVKFDYLANKLTYNLIKVFNKCDECWAVNSEVARIFYEDYHYKTLPKTMNNATEMMPVKNEDFANNYINKKHNLKKDEIVFLFVGRINILKNILFIADSIKIVQEKMPKLKFKMLYVGSGQDEAKLREHIKKINIMNNVILCGKITNREELSYYYKRAYLFLFPSIYDASSIVQIEAASGSTPGLFLKGTATAATITDNVNGFISNNTVEDYANRIIEILNDKSLYNKVSKNAYRDLYKSWDDKIDEVYNLYLNIIERYKKDS